MKLRVLPLRFLIPLLVFMLVSLFSLIVMYLQYVGEQQNYLMSSEQRIRSLMVQTQRHLERSLLNRDEIHVEEEIMSLALVDEIKFALLLDANGEIRFGTERRWRKKIAAAVLEDFSISKFEQVVSTLQPSIIEDNKIVRVYFPVLLEAPVGRIRSGSVGVLYVEWSLRSYYSAARSLLIKNIVVVGLIGIIAVALLSWVLSIFVIRPIKSLQSGIESTRSSQPYVGVKEVGAEELVGLSHSYNLMQKKMTSALGALRNSEERWLFALDSSGDGVADWNMRTDEVFFSRRLRLLLGFEHEDYLGSYEDWKKLVHEDDRDMARKELKRYLAGNAEVFQTEYRICSGGDEYRWMFVRGKVVERGSEGKPLRFVSTFSDFTERRNMEDALKQSEAEYRYLFELAQEGIWVVDEDSVTTMVNQSMAKMLGYECEDMVGKLIYDFMDEQRHVIYREKLENQRDSEPRQHDFELITKDGCRIFTNMSTAPIVTDGVHKGTIAGVIDITARIEAEDLVRRQANYDALTDLPNRRMLFERLEEELSRSRRHDHMGAVLFIDLDHFKNINDSLGHPVGDKLLMVIAKRMQETVRDEDVLARLGGDEFVVLVPEISTDIALASEAARKVAMKLQEAVSAYFMVEGHQLSVSCSIGISLYPKDNETIHDIFRQADAAMYQSKEDGRNTVRFFSRDMQAVAEQRMQLQMLLPRALDKNQFFLQYQPQVDGNGMLIGAEALVRWQQPSLGLVRPDKFISVAEESGLIIPLGDWITREACAQLSDWEAMGVPTAFNRIAINISPRQFILEDFADRIRKIVAESGISPMQVELEITEGMLLDNLDVMVEKMKALKEMGFLLSIDDFGTGYSSLSYLKSLPLSKLKIDQSFTRDLEHDKNDRAIVETIVSMARHLDLDVLAEGVETEEQLKFLMEKGCEKYQGYFFSKPLMPEEFYELWIKPHLAAQQGSSGMQGLEGNLPKH